MRDKILFIVRSRSCEIKKTELLIDKVRKLLGNNIKILAVYNDDKLASIQTILSLSYDVAYSEIEYFLVLENDIELIEDRFSKIFDLIEFISTTLSDVKWISLFSDITPIEPAVQSYRIRIGKNGYKKKNNFIYDLGVAYCISANFAQEALSYLIGNTDKSIVNNFPVAAIIRYIIYKYLGFGLVYTKSICNHIG